MPTKIILESSLHKFVPTTTLQQIIRDHKAGSPQTQASTKDTTITSPPLSQPATALPSAPHTRPSTIPTHLNLDASPSSPAPTRRPIKSNSVGALSRPTWSILTQAPACKPNSPLITTRPREASIPGYTTIHSTGMPPQHPNKLMVRSASSPKPSRRLRRYF